MLMRSKVAYQGQRSSEVQLCRKCLFLFLFCFVLFFFFLFYSFFLGGPLWKVLSPIGTKLGSKVQWVFLLLYVDEVKDHIPRSRVIWGQVTAIFFNLFFSFIYIFIYLYIYFFFEKLKSIKRTEIRRFFFSQNCRLKNIIQTREKEEVVICFVFCKTWVV